MSTSWRRLAVLAVPIVLVLACGGQQGLSAQQAPSAPSTPAATATPEPTPVPPITLSGTGSKVADPVDVPAGLWRVAWKADGTSNFIVHVHGQEDRGLVNVILPNPSSGEAAFQSAGGRFVFEVKADGATWTITLTRVSA